MIAVSCFKFYLQRNCCQGVSKKQKNRGRLNPSSHLRAAVTQQLSRVVVSGVNWALVLPVVCIRCFHAAVCPLTARSERHTWPRRPVLSPSDVWSPCTAWTAPGPRASSGSRTCTATASWSTTSPRQTPSYTIHHTATVATVIVETKKVTTKSPVVARENELQPIQFLLQY